MNENRELYLDILFGDWYFLNETKISTGHQIACDLNHPNIKRIFTKAREDIQKLQSIVSEAYSELEI
jgi:hypothetical protein